MWTWTYRNLVVIVNRKKQYIIPGGLNMWPCDVPPLVTSPLSNWPPPSVLSGIYLHIEYAQNIRSGIDLPSAAIAARMMIGVVYHVVMRTLLGPWKFFRL